MGKAFRTHSGSCAEDAMAARANEMAMVTKAMPTEFGTLQSCYPASLMVPC